MLGSRITSHLCRIRCGGTREAGDGGFRTCKTRGHNITICGACYKEIKPIWVMSAAEREEKLRDGMSFDALVLHEVLQTGLEQVVCPVCVSRA
jgi:hypothetical protein